MQNIGRDLEWLTWHSDDSRIMMYNWVEEDGGPTVSIPLTLAYRFGDSSGSNVTGTTGFTLTFQQRDDTLGDALVEYSGTTTQSYSTGKVRFWVREY